MGSGRMPNHDDGSIGVGVAGGETDCACDVINCRREPRALIGVRDIGQLIGGQGIGRVDGQEAFGGQISRQRSHQRGIPADPASPMHQDDGRKGARAVRNEYLSIDFELADRGGDAGLFDDRGSR